MIGITPYLVSRTERPVSVCAAISLITTALFCAALLHTLVVRVPSERRDAVVFFSAIVVNSSVTTYGVERIETISVVAPDDAVVFFNACMFGPGPDIARFCGEKREIVRANPPAPEFWTWVGAACFGVAMISALVFGACLAVDI